jgi:serine O-acetyltransferase
MLVRQREEVQEVSWRVEASDSAADTESLLDTLTREHGEHPLPHDIRQLAERFVYRMLGVLFPQFAAAPRHGRDELTAELDELRELLHRGCASAGDGPGEKAAKREAADYLFSQLGRIREALLLDAQAIYDGDPAAESLDEVILAYPGFIAIATHRIAHGLYGRVELFPRVLTEVAHRLTGIDIHPGARIGEAFAIDHGTGIVIGETSQIGDRVRLYQGVTLGAARVNKRMSRLKRHPTICDDVVIYANATILGGETVVGSGCRIGGNVWLTRSVPPYSVVTATSKVELHETSTSPPDDLSEFNIGTVR